MANAAQRDAEGASRADPRLGRFPLCGRGDVNTYAVFAETNRSIISPTGRVGCIVPTGIATDDTTKFFFQDLVERGALRAYSTSRTEGSSLPISTLG